MLFNNEYTDSIAHTYHPRKVSETRKILSAVTGKNIHMLTLHKVQYVIVKML